MRWETCVFLKIFVLVATVRTSIGIDKHWLPDLEWQTGSNWDGGLLPDADSRVIFPEETWHTVGLPNTGKVEVDEIVFPREGAISLGRNGILTFSGRKNPKKTVTWTKKGLYLWVDPDNWDGYTNATPHADRIPCERDVVVLPRKSRTLNMALPNAEVHVRGVRIADENTTLNNWEWGTITDEPREFHKSRLTVTYTGGWMRPTCDDCTCHGSNSGKISEEVCDYMWQAGKCGPRTCEYPLKVEGHCCEYCGGKIGLSDKASLRKVKKRVSKALENYGRDISWYVRKTSDSKTEILIAENGAYEGINSHEAVDTLANILKDEGYDVLEQYSTGFALTGTPLLAILIPMLGIPVIIILVILAAIPYYGYTYTQAFSGWREAFAQSGSSANSKSKPASGGSFGFARFQNLPEGDVSLNENDEVSVEEALEDDSDANGPSSSKRFENPLYRSIREDKKSKPIVEEKMIDIDKPVRLGALESRGEEHGIEEVQLD